MTATNQRLTFSSIPALNMVLTFHVTAFSGNFFLPSFVEMISQVDDDQECITSFPAQHDSTSGTINKDYD